MSGTKITHPEQEIENSLTAPSDRDPNRTYKPNQGHPQLSETDVENGAILTCISYPASEKIVVEI